MSSVGPPIFETGSTAPEIPQAPQGKGPNRGGIILLVLVALGLLALAFRTDGDSQEALPPTTLPPEVIDDFVAPDQALVAPMEPRFPPSGYTLSVVQTVIASPTAIRQSYGGFVAGETLGDMAFITSESGLQWSRNNAETVTGIPRNYQSDRLYALANGRLIGSFVDLARTNMVIATSDDGVAWNVGVELTSSDQLTMSDLVFADARLYLTVEERRNGERISRRQLRATWDLADVEPVPLEPGSYLRAMTDTFPGLVAIRTDDEIFGPPGSNHELVTVQNLIWGPFGADGLPTADVLDLHVVSGNLYAVTSTAVYRRVPLGGPWNVVAELVPPESGLQLVDHGVGNDGGAVLLKDTNRSSAEGQFVVLTSNDLTNWTSNRIVEQFSSMQLKTVGESAILEGWTPGSGPQRVQVPLR
ncbi:MAG: hypothetical protein HKN94_12310 [Acidimicrobiales bacterium]|nr:hypothetical protein [Acidimicrobiales bacterium]